MSKTLSQVIADGANMVFLPSTGVAPVDAGTKIGTAEIYYAGNNLTPYVVSFVGADPVVPGT